MKTKTAEEILAGFEPNREYPSYYHESNVLKAMEEFASQSKWVPVTERDWENLRGEFFAELTRDESRDSSIKEFNCMPHNVFEWFKKKLSPPQTPNEPQTT